MFYYV